MTSVSNFHIKDSISTQLLKMVFGVYLIIAVAVTLFHMVAEYYNMQESILDDLKVFRKTFEPSLAESLWKFDEKQTRATLKGMLNIPIIVGATVEDTDSFSLGKMGLVLNREGQTVSVDYEGNQVPVTQEFSKLLPHTFTITFQDEEGKRATLGQATIYSSSAIVFQKVQYGFVFIIINAMIKTIALWIIFLWLARILLTRPLLTLTNAVNDLNMDNLEELQIDVHTRGRNELKILEEAFNAMVHKFLLDKDRLISLRRLSDQLRSFKDVTQAFRFVFHELCAHISIISAAFYYDVQEGAFTQVEMHDPPAKSSFGDDLLKQIPSINDLDGLFTDKSQQVEVFNTVTPNSHIAMIYSDQPEISVEGCHFVYARADSLNQNVICLLRESGAPPFDSREIEYVKSLITGTQVST